MFSTHALASRFPFWKGSQKFQQSLSRRVTRAIATGYTEGPRRTVLFAAFGLTAVFVLTSVWMPGLAQAAEADAHDCTAFNALVTKTYHFDAAKLSDEQKLALEKELDKFWTAVKAHQKEYLPCLRKAVEDPASNAFFRFDGSNLLVELDPSLASKNLQVQVYTWTNWDLIGAERWMSVMLARGVEGIDISSAAERWFNDPEIGYTLPEHGGFEVDSFMGALFLFSSMDEDYATPALLKIINEKRHPQREAALELLTSQATPEAWRALKKLDMRGIADEARENVEALLEQPELIEPRDKPLVSRNEYVKSFQAFVKGDRKPFFDIVDKVGDGERDAVVVLQPEDLPLLRQVRRQFITGGNQHALAYYKDFTHILWTLVWKFEPTAAKVALR